MEELYLERVGGQSLRANEVKNYILECEGQMIEIKEGSSNL